MSSDWAASTLRWWEEAGVDTLVAEAPRNWLTHSPTVSAQPAVPAPRDAASPAGAPVSDPPPDTIEAFQAWLLTSDSLPYATPSAPRLGPSGDPSAELMVLVDMPAAEDLAAGALLSGEAGALFDRMLGAIGRTRGDLYLAPLSPIRTASGMLDAPGASALADVARHHVGLAAPRTLLLFGDACSKALLGASVSKARGKWHEFNTTAGNINTLVTIRPAKLIAVPALKKLAWEDLQMLMEGPKP